MRPWFVVLAFAVLPAVAMASYIGQINPWLWLGGAIGPSLLGFFLIAEDKSRARQGEYRIPESTLHLVELLGGWPGSYLAQQRFRHKTVKSSYRATFWLIVLIHQAIAIDALRGWPIVTALLG